MLADYDKWTYAAEERLERLPGEPVPDLFVNRDSALAWMDAERANLVAVAQWASESRHARRAIDVALRLYAYLWWRRHFDDWIAVSRCAQQAASRIGDPASEAMAWNGLGGALREAGRASEAIDALTRARDIFRANGLLHGEAMAWNNLGDALRETGRAADAIDAFTRARDLHHASGHRNHEAETWTGLGDALREANQMTKAIDAYTRARDMFQTTGDRHREAIAWAGIGIGLYEVGRTAESINAYRRALELRAEFDNWYETGLTLQNLAVAHRASGEQDHARTAWLQAADAFTRANAPAEAGEARRLAEEAQAPLSPPA